MNVRQNVHADIFKLSQELSAENGDNFGNGRIEKSGEIVIFDYFSIVFIGKKYQTCSKKIHFVSNADFWRFLMLCKIYNLLKNNNF